MVVSAYRMDCHSIRLVHAYLGGQSIILRRNMLDSLRELIHDQDAELSDVVGNLVLSMLTELRGLARFVGGRDDCDDLHGKK